MARVTVEDCMKKISNRFELVNLSVQRVKEIIKGAPISIERDNDKNPVVALREIAQGQIDPDRLRESAIRTYQKVNDADEEDEDIQDMLEEAAWLQNEDNKAEASQEIIEDGLTVIDEAPEGTVE
jgi:DNA-directed RNA polymerase subunit omega